jgi:hypothetical protein
MPIQATVILDSGCFLPLDNGAAYTEIGYFGSSNSVSDIRVIADGKEVKSDEPMNLGKQCKIEIRHVLADGTINRDGVEGAEGFHERLLHLKDLYNKDTPVDRAKFDCIIRFDSGLFCAALVKPRYFKKHKKQADGTFRVSDGEEPKLVSRLIAHNVYVQFVLNRGERLELARGGEVFWSSKGTGAKARLEVEIVADNTTTEKFYRVALKGNKQSYWMPNDGDPPPMCPEPPCQP